MASLEIRPALVSDSLGIAAVHVETWQDAFEGLMPNSYLQTLDVTERTASWIENLAHPDLRTQTFVAMDVGIVVGFIRVGVREDTPQSDESGEIWALYVHPNEQGKGIGNLLMAEGLRNLEVEGFQTAVLWVLEGNLKARRWYESRGWVLSGETKIEIGNGFASELLGYTKSLSKVTDAPQRQRKW